MIQRRTIALLLGAVCAWFLLGAVSWTNIPQIDEHEVLQDEAQGSSQIVHTDTSATEHTGIASARPRLHRRAPTLTNPNLFTTAKKRGQQLICAMGNPANAPQSPFSSFDDLATVSLALYCLMRYPTLTEERSGDGPPSRRMTTNPSIRLPGRSTMSWKQTISTPMRRLM